MYYLNKTDESLPVVTRVTPQKADVGDIVEIWGKNFSGFENDKTAWIVNSQGEKGVIYSEPGSTNKLIRFKLNKKYCTVDTSYSGLECPSYIHLFPGTYMLYVYPWGKMSNKVIFEVSDSHWKTYENKDYGFSVSYPKDWSVNDTSSYAGGSRQINIHFNGPLHSDIPNYKGPQVSWYFLIGGNIDTQQINFLPAFGCFSTPDPKYQSGQSPCNAPVDIEKEKNATEQIIMEKIVSTFKLTGEKGKFESTIPSITLHMPEDENWYWNGNHSISWTPIGLKNEDVVKVIFRTLKYDVACSLKTKELITVGNGSISMIKPVNVSCENNEPGLKIGEKYKVQIIVPAYDSGRGVADQSSGYITIVK